MFTLQKVSIMGHKSSAVAQGAEYRGDHIDLFKYDDRTAFKADVGLQLEEGWQVLLYEGRSFSLRTSKITQIVSRTEDEVTFWTETSLYRLKETE